VYYFFEYLPPELLGGLAIVIPLLQLVAAIHALRSGRHYYWLWIILIFPPLGAIAYFFVEMYPDWRRGSFSNPFTDLLDWWYPQREYQRLQEALDLSPTVTNRKNLAEYHTRHGEYAESIQLLEDCLRGPFKDDPGLHLDLARAHFQAGQYEDARILLEKMQKLAPGYEPFKRDFLLGRVCEEQGQKPAAAALYEKASVSYPGEEARVRLALLLEELGDIPKARGIYTDVVRRLRKAPRHYRREQQEWWTLAQERGRALGVRV
jgi:hypothetical protein